MFNGFLVKIDGTQVPNNYIVEDSYAVSSEPNVVSEYYDAAYNLHVIRAPQDKIEVSFDTRVMIEADYRILSSMIKEEMSIEYYDPFDGSYGTGIFTYEGNISPTIFKINKNTVYIKQQTIKLIRKRAE